ncbi:MAG: aryl-sulfate sulfotransferase [Chitinophagales bacterium]
MPGSKLHHPETNIILRNGNLIDVSTLKQNLFAVTGSESGKHDVSIKLSDDGKTILLQPTTVFSNDEEITIAVTDGLHTVDGKKINGTVFTFQTMPLPSDKTVQRMNDARRHIFEDEFGTATDAESSDTRDLSDWTGGFPPLTIYTNNNPAPGKVFFHNFDFAYEPTAHYCIMDNNADSVYGKFDQIKGIGFTINQNGYLTLFNNGLNRHEMLDSNYKMIDKFYCGNGYVTDVHEFIVLPNGHSYLLAYDPQLVDMTVYNPAYNPNAVVVGAIVQELDAGKNVVFQWRSWDHFQITDATHTLLSTSEIDYVHANSIYLEADGVSFLLSSRHMDEVTKISFTTGDIIWRLGGLNNQFTFIGDAQHFSYQHDARRIANGHLTLFDNGNYHFPAKSAAKEYILNEVAKTAKLTWKYERNLTGSSSAMGSVQRLPNGNTFICWGLVYSTVFPSVTEVTPEGNIVWEMRLDPEFNDGIYRAHRFMWTPCARPSAAGMNSLNVTGVSAKLKWQPATNALSYVIQYKPTSSGTWITKPCNNKSVTISGLTPNTSYDWQVRSVCAAPNPLSSGYSVKKMFTTLPQKLSDENGILNIEVFPNPSFVYVNIELELHQSGTLLINVFNMMGQQQLTRQSEATAGNNTLVMDVSEWPRGIYFVEATIGGERKVSKITVE